MNYFGFFVLVLSSQISIATLSMWGLEMFSRNKFSGLKIAFCSGAPIMLTTLLGFVWIHFLPVNERPGAGMMVAMVVSTALIVIPMSFVASLATWATLNRNRADDS